MDEQQQTSPRSSVGAAIEQWFVERFSGGVISRSAECSQAVHAAKDDLKRQIASDPAGPDAAIEAWFQGFAGGVVARSTECWNALHAAKDDLKQRLAKLT